MDTISDNLVRVNYLSSMTFRHFIGESDYSHMLDIVNGCKEIDGIERTDTIDDIRNYYEHLVNSDPYQDITFVEIDGSPIGYSRVYWDRLDDGIRTYTSFGYILPEWRRKGIGTEMLKKNQDRIREIASTHPDNEPKYYQSFAADTELSTIALLESQGYSPVRHEFSLVRDLKKPIPNLPLPQGLVIKPVQEEHIMPVILAADEAFQDHWGYRPTDSVEIERWKKSSFFQPELWKVAWDGNQVAGSVQNFYLPLENEEYTRKRGYTEGISTRRPWRKRGLASALIAESMKMFKVMGMTETAHDVDAENTSGALRLYKKLGYKVVKQYTTYRKTMFI